MLVIVLIALASGLVALTMRDGDADRLDREAVRLAALLDAARAASQASGIAVAFSLASPHGDGSADFGFAGLPPGMKLGDRWLYPGVQARLAQGNTIVLGPEPLIGAQRIVLSLGERSLTLASDGLGPFVLADRDAP